jgi:hypothetical protein
MNHHICEKSAFREDLVSHLLDFLFDFAFEVFSDGNHEDDNGRRGQSVIDRHDSHREIDNLVVDVLDSVPSCEEQEEGKSTD